MLKHHLKTAFRNLSRNKLYAGISIFSLGVGLAMCLLALQYLAYEFSFDSIKGANRVYEVVIRTQIERGSQVQVVIGTGKKALSTAAPPGLIGSMKSYFSSIESGVSIYPVTIDLPLHDRPDISARFWGAGPAVLKILDLHLLEGDAATCLQAPNSIVLSKRLALKYFGRTDVIGRTVEAGLYLTKYDFIVTGVLSDNPGNHSYSFDALGSGMVFPWIRRDVNSNFRWWTAIPGVLHFIKLRRGARAGSISRRMVSFVKTTGGMPDYQLPVLIPMKELHFRTDIDNGLSTYQQKYLFILAGVALLVLLVSSFNFLGLNLTLFSRRLKEIGIRRVIGGQGANLSAQFFVENMLLSAAAFILAFCLAELLLPLFNSMMGLNLTHAFLMRPISLAFIILIALILNGLMSAWSIRFFTVPNPQTLIRGKTTDSLLRLTTRQLLIGFQFAVAAFLICCAVIVIDQLNFVRQKNLGFDPKNVLVIDRESVEGGPDVAGLLKTELKRDSNILDVTSAGWIPGQNDKRYLFPLTAEGGKYRNGVTLRTAAVDAGFVPTLRLQIVRGRDFDARIASDTETVIVNQTAVRELGLSGPNSDSIQFLGNEWKVTGVVKDFNYQSLRHQVQPLVLQYFQKILGPMAVRFRKGSEGEVLAYVRKVWRKVRPNRELEYSFLQDTMNRLYANDHRLFTALLTGSALAVLISLMGIFALSSFLVETKTKEIAVRKVLGSSVSGIIHGLSRDFIRLVVIANVIAWPFAYFVMKNWLQNYAYRIRIDLLIFPLAGVTMAVLLLATVLFRVLKAAKANPIESLRYE